LGSTSHVYSVTLFFQKVEPQVSQRDSSTPNEMAIIEGLMETHDATLSNLRSRLTKLQVILASL